MSSHSVTRWINELRDGDRSAANRLWDIVQQRVIRTARSEVARTAHVVYDEEDVAISAYRALCDGVERGRYDGVADRQQLWRLLAVITVNKARNRASHENRIRRGGRSAHVSDAHNALGIVPSAELGPEDHAVEQEECQRLLDMLEKRELKLVAILKVEGHTNEEIASQLGCTRRTVQRRLDMIRTIWSEEKP